MQYRRRVAAKNLKNVQSAITKTRFVALGDHAEFARGTSLRTLSAGTNFKAGCANLHDSTEGVEAC